MGKKNPSLAEVQEETYTPIPSNWSCHLTLVLVLRGELTFVRAANIWGLTCTGL